MADDPVPSDGDGGDESHGDLPFAGMPMFGDLARMLQSQLQGQGPLSWDTARQFALLGATEGNPESNVDPAVRIVYVDLARIAGMHVNDVTGNETAFPEPRVVTRGQWTAETLDAYRPLFTDLATSLGQVHDPASTDTPQQGDPFVQMLAGLSRMMGPTMMGMSVGSMVGSLAKRVFGLHDLPIPRPKQEVVLVAGTIDQFAADWEIPVDEMRLWVLAHELSGFQIFSIGHVRETLAGLVRAHVGGFRPDPSTIADKLAGFDPFGSGDDPTRGLQQLFGDPEVLLGAVRSPEQLALQPRLDAAVAAAVGYTDWVVDAVAVRVIGGEALRIAEAVRRQRASTSDEDVFVERLLGIRLDDEQVSRGKAFVQGVVDRVGEHDLTRLFALPDSTPTPSEIEAPGLWIARVAGD